MRCAAVNLDEILSSFTGKRINFNFPLSYLGLALTLGRLKLVHLQPTLDKVKARLAYWQGKLLTATAGTSTISAILNAYISAHSSEGTKEIHKRTGQLAQALSLGRKSGFLWWQVQG